MVKALFNPSLLKFFTSGTSSKYFLEDKGKAKETSPFKASDSANRPSAPELSYISTSFFIIG